MTKKSRRLPLADWQRDDSDRLKEIYRRKRGVLKLTQQTIALALGDGVNQGTVSLFMNRRTALSLETAAVFARVLEVPVSEFSPILADQLKTKSFSLSPPQDCSSVKDSVLSTSAAYISFPDGDEFDCTHNDKDTFTPHNKTRATARDRHVNSRADISSALVFNKSWLRMTGANQKCLNLVTSTDDSMWPTISDHDVLLVDESQTVPADGQIYVMVSADKGMSVKRLVKAPSGGWIIRSDEEDKVGYPDQELSASDASAHRIVGRVVGRGGDL